MTYCPGRTLPIVKLPLIFPVPACIMQAEAIAALEPGLEIVHEVSVGKNPVPLTAILTPS
jgi:hypothetical protein